MSQKDFVEKVILELGKLHEWAEHLKDQATNEKINRIECKRTLYDISASMFLMVQLAEMVPTKGPKSKSGKNAFKEINEQAKNIETVAQNIENERMYEEKSLRTRLFQFSHSLNQLVIGADIGYRENFGTSAISSIGLFLANRSLNLTEPWVVANCYLTAIDVVVNKRRAEFKIANPVEKKEMNIPFDQRYKELVDEMKTQGYKISEVLGPLANYFWDMRTKIIHYGFIPNRKELQLIVDYSTDILRMLTSTKKS